MSRTQSRWPALTVAAYPQQYHSLVDLIEILWTELQFFQDSRSIRVNDYISLADEQFDELKVLLVLEIDNDALFIAVHDVLVDGHGDGGGLCSCN